MAGRQKMMAGPSATELESVLAETIAAKRRAVQSLQVARTLPGIIAKNDAAIARLIRDIVGLQAQLEEARGGVLADEQEIGAVTGMLEHCLALRRRTREALESLAPLDEADEPGETEDATDVADSAETLGAESNGGKEARRPAASACTQSLFDILNAQQ